MSRHTVTLYHNPHSRSHAIRILLEMLGAPYELKLIDFAKKESRTPEFLAINPMGKLPTLIHNGVVVTEKIACALYLADAFPANTLAPALSDLQRGEYLRWMLFYAASFEPAVVDKASKVTDNEYMNGYGTFETAMSTLEAKLDSGTYILGDTFSAADIVWCTALCWITMFNIIEKTPIIAAYIERITTLPSWQAVDAKEHELAMKMGLLPE